MRLTWLVAFCVLLSFAGLARADDRFHAVPGAAKSKKQKLKLRVVSYDGDTNGELAVEVRNAGKKAATFSAQGLYFIPDGDADEAPQRLGAVGPFVVAGSDDREDTVTIAAGDTVTVILDVFCIDSHRDSPDPSTPFTVSSKRMPAQLARKIDEEASEAKKGSGSREESFDDVQDEVWRARDKAWVKLKGEGSQEADK